MTTTEGTSVPNSDLNNQAVVEAAADGGLRLVCERADHFIATIDPGDSLSSLIELVEQHDCTDEEPAHYPIFTTYDQQQAVLDRLPTVDNRPNPGQDGDHLVAYVAAQPGTERAWRCQRCPGVWKRWADIKGSCVTATNAQEADRG